MLGVPPPTIHVHLRIIDPTDGSIPGVPAAALSSPRAASVKPVLPGLASESEAKAFGEWLRGRWADKETLMDGFTAAQWQGFQDTDVGDEEEERNKEALYGEGSVAFPIRLT